MDTSTRMGALKPTITPARGTLHLAVFLTLAAGIVAGTWRISSQSTKVFQESFEKELADLDELKINQLILWQAERKGDALVAMSSARLMPELEKAVANEPAARAATLQWMEDIRRSYRYASVELLDRAGTIRIASGSSPIGPVFYQDLAEEAEHSGRMFFRYFPQSSDLARSVFAACAPLHSGRGALFGSLVLIVDPWLSPFPDILKWPSASRTGRLFLARREGTATRLIGVNFRDSDARPYERLLGADKNGPLYPAALDLQEGPIHGLDDAGRHVTGVVRSLPSDPNDKTEPVSAVQPVMIATMEESEAFAPLRQNKLLLALASGLLIALCGAGVGGIWRQQMIQSWRQQLKSEQERRALIGHYDYLTRFANDAVFLADSGGKVVEVNERASDFYGYSTEEMIGMTVDNFRAPGTQRDYELAQHELRKQGRVVFESMAVRKGGGLFPAELSVREMEVEGARYRQTIVRDITERRRSQQQIQRLNRLYAVLSRCGQAIVKNQDELPLFQEVVGVAVDDGGFCIAAVGLVDPVTAKIALVARAGAAAEYLDVILAVSDDLRLPRPAGKSIRESGALICNDLWLEGAADREGNATAIEAARRFNVRSLVLLPLWRGGRLAGELRLYSAEPEFFNEEEIELATEVAENLSFALESLERKRKQQIVEAELRSNRERLEMVLDAAEEAYWDWDLESGAILQSPRYDAMLGYGPYEVPRGFQEWISLVHPEDATRVNREFSQFLASHDDLYSNEFRMRSKPGEYIWIFCRAKVVRRNAEGVPVRVVGTLTEVTDKKRLEEQFRQSQKLESVGRLAGGVAHDFNNLLTVINGYSRLLIKGAPPSDPRLRQLQEISKAGERAAELTKQLLTFSRKNISEPRLVRLNSVAADCETILRRLTPDNIEFSVSFGALQDEVVIDPSHVQQVLMNLVVNACDAMPSGGRLSLRTSNVDAPDGIAAEAGRIQKGLWLLLEVTDTGAGMDEDTLRHIFEPFFTTKEIGKGTGLGLSTVYGILQQCGGTIQVESRPGAGSSFKIYLPVASEGVLATGSVKSEPARGLAGTETVLVVEDQDVVREYTESALRTYGYTVISASNGAEAIDLADRQPGPIHLLVTDVIMPSTNGWIVARELRKTRPEMGVLYVSGYVDDIAGGSGEMEPDAAFLQKPFSPEALAAKVRRVLNKSAVSRTILVVEDEPAVRELFTDFLGRKHKLVMAGDGREAMKILQSGTAPDLVITDMVMPNQEGIDLIREIRRSHPAIRIIAMSGAFSGRFLKTAELLGADATLVKPVRPEVLDQLVEDLLARSEARSPVS